MGMGKKREEWEKHLQRLCCMPSSALKYLQGNLVFFLLRRQESAHL